MEGFVLQDISRGTSVAHCFLSRIYYCTKSSIPVIAKTETSIWRRISIFTAEGRQAVCLPSSEGYKCSTLDLSQQHKDLQTFSPETRQPEEWLDNSYIFPCSNHHKGRLPVVVELLVVFSL